MARSATFASLREMASDVWQELFGLAEGSALLDLALTHPSYANETKRAGDNQRLEFLGDAILGFCASELLYSRFPDADEGTLTRT